MTQASVVLGPHIREKIHLADAQGADFLALNNHDIGDEGAFAVAEMLKTNRTIQKVYLNQCRITDKGAEAMADVLRNSETITDLHLSLNPITEQGMATITEAISSSRNKNILMVNGGGKETPADLSAILRKNRDDAQFWSLRGQDTTVALSPAEMRNMDVRLSAIRDTSKPAYDHFTRKLQLMPPMPAAGEGFAEALFTPAYSGYAPLDNPHLWKGKYGLQALKDVPFTPEFLTRQTEKKSNFVDSALHGMPAADFMKLFNDKKITLGAKELLDPDKKPTALLETFLDKKGGVEALFTLKNWEGKRTELQAVYKAIPEGQKPANFQTLLLQCAPATMQGIGR